MSVTILDEIRAIEDRLRALKQDPRYRNYLEDAAKARKERLDRIAKTSPLIRELNEKKELSQANIKTYGNQIEHLKSKIAKERDKIIEYDSEIERLTLEQFDSTAKIVAVK